jgi:hypothetical protein
VDLLGSRLSSSFTQRAFAVNQLGVYPLRVGQFEPTITRVVLEVDPTAGDWETTYDPQKGGVNILPAGGESQASLLPSTPTNYQGSLATIQSVQLKDNFLTIVADGSRQWRISHFSNTCATPQSSPQWVCRSDPDWDSASRSKSLSGRNGSESNCSGYRWTGSNLCKLILDGVCLIWIKSLSFMYCKLLSVS